MLASASLLLAGVAAQSTAKSTFDVRGEGRHSSPKSAHDIARFDLNQRAVVGLVGQSERAANPLAVAIMQSCGGDWYRNVHPSEIEDGAGMIRCTITATVDSKKLEAAWKQTCDFVKRIGVLKIAVNMTGPAQKRMSQLVQQLKTCGFEVVDAERFAKIRDSESKIAGLEGGDSTLAFRLAAREGAHVLVEDSGDGLKALWVETALELASSESSAPSVARDQLCQGLCMALGRYRDSGLCVQIVFKSVPADRRAELDACLKELRDADVLRFGAADIESKNGWMKVDGQTRLSVGELAQQVLSRLPKEALVREESSSLIKLELAFERK